MVRTFRAQYTYLPYIYADGEPMDQALLEDDLANMEMAADGDNEEELFDEVMAPEEVSESLSGTEKH
jgi:hypothetical protein